MKIIVNRGFDKSLMKITIYKNGQEKAFIPRMKDYCELGAKEGDKIDIKIRQGGNFTIASFNCHNAYETLYISPTKPLRRWTEANYRIFPAFFLLFFVLKTGIKSDVLDLYGAATAVLWALSLICMGFSIYFPSIRKEMYYVEILK